MRHYASKNLAKKNPIHPNLPSQRREVMKPVGDLILKDM